MSKWCYFIPQQPVPLQEPGDDGGMPPPPADSDIEPLANTENCFSSDLPPHSGQTGFSLFI